MDENKQWKILEETHTPHFCPAGKMIYLQGTHAEEFYYLKSGKVKIFLSSEHGMEKALTVLESGHIFGEAAFFDGMPRVSSAKALEPSEVIRVTRRSLTECIRRDPQFALDLLTYLSQTIRMLSAQVDSMTFLRADRRIARLLLSLSAADGAAHTTHDDLAELAGVSLVTVSRVLARFAARGWIKTGYRTVRIRDAGGLKKFTEENG